MKNLTAISIDLLFWWFIVIAYQGQDWAHGVVSFSVFALCTICLIMALGLAVESDACDEVIREYKAKNTVLKYYFNVSWLMECFALAAIGHGFGAACYFICGGLSRISRANATERFEKKEKEA